MIEALFITRNLAESIINKIDTCLEEITNVERLNKLIDCHPDNLLQVGADLARAHDRLKQREFDANIAIAAMQNYLAETYPQ